MDFDAPFHDSGNNGVGRRYHILVSKSRIYRIITAHGGFVGCVDRGPNGWEIQIIRDLGIVDGTYTATIVYIVDAETVSRYVVISICGLAGMCGVDLLCSPFRCCC